MNYELQPFLVFIIKINNSEKRTVYYSIAIEIVQIRQKININLSSHKDIDISNLNASDIIIHRIVLFYISKIKDN